MKATKTLKVKPSSKFSISLNLGGKTIASSGNTLLDALVALPKPQKIVGKGILTITNGDMRSEQMFWPIRLKRLFYNKSFQIIQAKQLGLFLKPIKRVDAIPLTKLAT